MWKDDSKLFSFMRTRIFPAVVGDILDTLGLMQKFLQPAIKPVKRPMVVAGRAMPMLEINCFSRIEPEGKSSLSQQAFGLLFQALDDLEPNEVYIATGSAPQFALWGSA
ncbi:hypothetical protein [Variovorax paradoxus]|uniref:hypothetical protein n=1 Tax=Variovorax paradoxus TaxID=34073 RepID=UPI002478E470